tara:strand:+ start:906 stop:1121 length:216 start_codon:yes stop_codon:yes gene_type:complete
MFTVWFCSENCELLYCKKSFINLNEAKTIKKEDFDNLLWLKNREIWWIVIRDRNDKIVFSTRKQIHQISLF